MDGVNVLDSSLRTTIKKEVPFIPGAYVLFYDSLTAADIKQAQILQAQEIKNVDDSFSLLLAQVASWNFTDGTNPLPLTIDSLSKFTTKLLTWFSETETEILTQDTTDKKKGADNLSNSSPVDTPIV